MSADKNKKKKVLLIGWDAADWKVINPLLDQGLMPHLEKLIDGGVMGNLATLDPPLSPTLWTSIATGKRPYKHGIHGFTEPDPKGNGVRPVYITSRKGKALWNILMQSGYKSNIVGWWPSHPAEPIDGVYISNFYQKSNKDITDWKLLDGVVHPPEMADMFANLRVHRQELTANHFAPFLNTDAYDPKNENHKKKLKALANITAEAASIHSAATYLLEFTDWDFMAVYHDAIDHYCHGFMKYHPPRRPHIKEDVYDVFKDVVVGGYRYHDMMLGRMMQFVDEDTTVILISDHGFHPDHLRPVRLPMKEEPAAPALEHSPYGIIVMKGPGIKKDERIYGASLIDITPTILNLYDLPTGKDMDGKILTNAFEETRTLEYVESWDLVPGDCGLHEEGAEMDAAMSEEVLEQLVELGYIDKPHPDKQKEIERTLEYNSYFLARAYMDGKKYEEALPIYEKLFKNKPTNSRFGSRLVRAYMLLDKMEKARETFDMVKELKTEDTVELIMLEGQLNLSEKKPKKAMELYKKAESMAPEHAGQLKAQIGRGYIRLNKWKDAERILEESLEHNYENASTHHKLGQCYMKLGKTEQAVEALLTAIGLTYHFPFAHFDLGKALFQLQEYERAAEALEVALRLGNIPNARALLTRIYEKHLDEPVKAAAQKSALSQSAIKTITVVSGLPRSGTSMMMQMLDKGGMDCFTDKKREADENNPKGYYEHDAVKNLIKDKRFLREIEGEVVKVIAQLLQHLPSRYKYKVIFMDRDLNEVLRSQHKMLNRLGKLKEDVLPLRLLQKFETSLKQVQRWLPEQANFEVLYVPHRAVIKNPLQYAQEVNDFLGGHLDVAKMAAVVDPSLHREKAPEKTAADV